MFIAFFFAPQKVLSTILSKLFNYQEYGLKEVKISQYFYNVFNAFLIEKHIIGENGWQRLLALMKKALKGILQQIIFFNHSDTPSGSSGH